MDLLVGIRKTGGTIGIRATCGICRERRRVQQREQHGHKHRRGKRTEEAHAHSFGGAGRRVAMLTWRATTKAPVAINAPVKAAIGNAFI